MITLLNELTYFQLFAISEFDFCYNYAFYKPFQEKLQLVFDNTLTFEDVSTRDLCSRTENVLFREVNQSAFSIRIDAEFDLNRQPFSLFFFVFANVTIIDTQVNMRLSNSSGSDFAFLAATVPEYSITVLGSSFDFASKDSISNFYGIANNVTELLTINRSSFVYKLDYVVNFYGISNYIQDIIIQNSSIIAYTKASINCGIAVQVLGYSNFINLSITGSLQGQNTFGFIFENRGACIIANITYSLFTSGSSFNCGFVQFNTGLGTVTTFNISFTDLENYQAIGQLSQYSGQCPCMPDSKLKSGLCYCATGSVPFKNICKCTTPNAFIKNEACACGVNATNISNSCICPTGSTLIEGVCKCSNPKQAPVDGACQCFTKFSYLVGSSCECPVNSTNVSNTCTCPTGSKLINNVCVCQTANSFPDSARTACVCPADATNNTVTNVCECPQYSTIVVAQAACVCQPAYMVMSAKQCICSQTLMKGSINVNGVCKCPYQAVYGDKVCACQIRGSTLEGNVCKCTWDQSGSAGFQGNYWCKNHMRCCTDIKRLGWDYWCYDKYFQYCTAPKGDIVAE
ncbi:Conserved_hypothetical protein [Hexamita inflata]|uniref:Uncharacterized protein n=1 Tax=Hexamita inflata TaxID=28002 RepID=A0AA86THM0_9EUKA|nr:Conserved hypothetical protein [Hexamita inflata]